MTTPMVTRSQSQGAQVPPSQTPVTSSLTPREHVLQIVLNLPADSPLQKALEHNYYAEPNDFITELDAVFDNLEYPNDTGALVKLPKGLAGMLKSLKHFTAFRTHQGTPIVDWTLVTKSEYDGFRTSSFFQPVPVAPFSNSSTICTSTTCD